VAHELLKRTPFLDDYRQIVLKISDANPMAADRFCDAVESALEMLAKHPEIGPKAGFLRAPQTRFWPLGRFPNCLIFYRISGSSIMLLRLLHGARNRPRFIPAE